MRLIIPELLEDNLQQLKLRDRIQDGEEEEKVRKVPKDKKQAYQRNIVRIKRVEKENSQSRFIKNNVRFI